MFSMDHVTINQWAGRDNYRCRYCKHATLDPDIAAEHWQRAHAPPPPAMPVQRLTPFLDANGRPLVVTEEPVDAGEIAKEQINALRGSRLDDLPEALAVIDDPGIITVASNLDPRKGATQHYQQRLQELQPSEPEAQQWPEQPSP